MAYKTSVWVVKVSLPAGTAAYSRWIRAEILIPETGATYTEVPITEPTVLVDAYITSQSPVDYIFRVVKDRLDVVATSQATVNQLVATNPAKPKAFPEAIGFMPYKVVHIEVTPTANVGTADVSHEFTLQVIYGTPPF